MNVRRKALFYQHLDGLSARGQSVMGRFRKVGRRSTAPSAMSTAALEGAIVGAKADREVRDFGGTDAIVDEPGWTDAPDIAGPRRTAREGAPPAP